MKTLAGGNHNGVVVLGKQDEGIFGAVAQQRAVDQGLEPGQDRREKIGDEPLDEGWNIWQVALAGAQHRW
jgi:hypothetical protein